MKTGEPIPIHDAEEKTSLKGVFPFRLGTTSYIIKDDLVPNTRFLGPLVDDIELVLFESDEISNLPDRDVIDSLGSLKAEHGITFTVHLPLDTQLGSLDGEERRRSVEKCLRVMEITSPLEPFAYIVHFHGEMRGRVPAADTGKWAEALDRSADDLLETGTDPGMLCVETLDYPFEVVEDIVRHHGMSVCLDVGHLAFFGYSLEEYLDRYLALSPVIHVHGNCNNTDHRDISMLDQGFLTTLMDYLHAGQNSEQVVTLEIFGEKDFEQSMKTMEGLRR